MILFPAVDIKENQCVRLTQGDFNQKIVYSNKPVEMALKWEKAGAKYLHIVDLDGAESLSLINKKSIEEIISKITIPIQIGGGIRSKERVKQWLDLGVTRVILGTILVEEPDIFKEIASTYAENIAVSVDAIEGKAAIRGWKDVTNTDVLEITNLMEQFQVKTLIYTDILRDGMLKGPNFQMYQRLQEKTTLDIVASGGVSSLEDIKTLKEMNMYGAIIGKALYDGKIDFEEALSC